MKLRANFGDLITLMPRYSYAGQGPVQGILMPGGGRDARDFVLLLPSMELKSFSSHWKLHSVDARIGRSAEDGPIALP